MLKKSKINFELYKSIFDEQWVPLDNGTVIKTRVWEVDFFLQGKTPCISIIWDSHGLEPLLIQLTRYQYNKIRKLLEVAEFKGHG